MNNPFEFVVIALAALYLSHMLTSKAGPFNVFATIRRVFPLGGLTTCLYCSLFWIGITFYLLWKTPLQPIVECFGVAGGAMFVYRYTGASHVD